MYTLRSNQESITAKSNASRLFFGDGPSSASFFGPLIQRQPAKDESIPDPKEILEMGKQIEDDLAKGKQSICELLKSLFQQFLDPQGRIDANTPDIIDVFTGYTTECSTICPYIKQHPGSIKGAHYKVFSHYRGNDDPKAGRFMNDDWHKAVGKYLNTHDADEIKKVGGFYNSKDNSISLPSDAFVGSALHEAIHRLSQPAFKMSFGHHLNEGVTQYFADYILKELNVPVFIKHSYQEQLKDATTLAGRIGDVNLAKMYFSSDLGAEKEAMIKLGIIKSDTDLYFYDGKDVLKAIGSHHSPD